MSEIIATVSDPIDDSDLKREGKFLDLWEQMGVEFFNELLKTDFNNDVWINLNMTVGGDAYKFNRTISITE